MNAEKLSHSDKSLEKKIPPVVLLGIHLVLAFVISRLPGPHIPAAVGKPLAVMFMLSAFSLVLVAVLHFKLAKTTVNPLKPEKASSLVQNGIYRLSRNPMYLAMLLCLLAATCFFGSLLSLLLVPCFIAVMNKLQIEPEEAVLLELFDKEFKQYRDKVRRWI